MDTIENKFKNLHAVIMAGGVGSRFWPYSRNQKPKQFLDILNCGSSLLQLTYQRLKAIIPMNNIWVVSHVDYSNLVKDQLPDISSDRILLEPSRKNTAACIMYASKHIQEVDPESLVFIAPSDHLIINTLEFNNALIKSAAFLANQSEGLLTFGIKASRPDTGYGYIRFSKNEDSLGVWPVAQFVEKPDPITAKSYMDSGNYVGVWNSGMFLWKMQLSLK
ncbi:MAG: NTP transferase domain-containing protein [Saprospiraceae bacterium]|nr:NTP transferase domain-containing protein [Saprospiraceae bacterium]